MVIRVARSPPEVRDVPGGHPATRPNGLATQEVSMSWVKPDFEVVELGMEVTAYVYNE
jgi:coenzyme PQQ precursor peptide PqqA